MLKGLKRDIAKERNKKYQMDIISVQIDNDVKDIFLNNFEDVSEEDKEIEELIKGIPETDEDEEIEEQLKKIEENFIPETEIGG